MKALAPDIIRNRTVCIAIALGQTPREQEGYDEKYLFTLVSLDKDKHILEGIEASTSRKTTQEFYMQRYIWYNMDSKMEIFECAIIEHTRVTQIMPATHGLSTDIRESHVSLPLPI